MTFTPEQIEEFRREIGGTTEGAEQAMQSVARMCAKSAGWVAVNQRLPEFGVVVLGYWGTNNIASTFVGPLVSAEGAPIGVYWADAADGQDGCAESFREPTHWMPVPPVPA